MKHGGTQFKRCLSRAFTPVGLVCIGVALFGCIAVYNATFHLEDPFTFIARQSAWLIIAAICLAAATAAPFNTHRKLIPAYSILAYVPLILVLFFGLRVHGMRGWFSVGGVFYQPGEMAKPAFVLCLAWILDVTKWRRREFLRGFLPALGILLAWTLPILLQPDFGAVLIYGATFLVVCSCAGVRPFHLFICVALMVPVAVWMCSSHPYVLERFAGFLQTGRYADSHAWHIVQFRRCLASGGLFGKWWGHGVWSRTYLPLGYSDSIFATLGEAIGFVGLVPFVGLVVAWAFYGYAKVRRCTSVFAVSTLVGLVGYLCIQAFVHLSVNLALMPPTGITLPLISYGGSSLVSSAIAIGIVESLVRDGGGQAPEAVSRSQSESDFEE